jgi:GDSL-like Lipase/Acylhydrolase family
LFAKIVSIAFIFIFGLLLLLEIGLRMSIGLGNPLLYIKDKEIGYLLAPSQKVRRMGNRININEYSMRSSSIDKKRAPSTLRVLLIGDSIANGGWWTDRDETISALLKNNLAQTLKVFSDFEVLNASANSWGPRNELAYLRRFGTFETQTIVLLINTDDLFASAPTSLPVGRDRNYPERKPALALIELFQQKFARPQAIPGMAEIHAEGGDRVGINLQAIKEIKMLADRNNARLLLAMTPLLREVGETGSREYEIKARNRLQEFTQTEEITYLDFLPIFKQVSSIESLYRDRIHLSPEGNRLVSDRISQMIGDKGK